MNKLIDNSSQSKVNQQNIVNFTKGISMDFEQEATFVLGARMNAKLLQKDLAKKLGIAGQFLGRIEKGHSGLPLRIAKKFCKITKADPNLLADCKSGDYKMFCKKKMGIALVD